MGSAGGDGEEADATVRVVIFVISGLYLSTRISGLKIIGALFVVVVRQFISTRKPGSARKSQKNKGRKNAL